MWQLWASALEHVHKDFTIITLTISASDEWSILTEKWVGIKLHALSAGHLVGQPIATNVVGCITVWISTNSSLQSMGQFVSRRSQSHLLPWQLPHCSFHSRRWRVKNPIEWCQGPTGWIIRVLGRLVQRGNLRRSLGQVLLSREDRKANVPGNIRQIYINST